MGKPYSDGGVMPARLAAASQRAAIPAGLASRAALASVEIARSREITSLAGLDVPARRCAPMAGFVANALEHTTVFHRLRSMRAPSREALSSAADTTADIGAGGGAARGRAGGVAVVGVARRVNPAKCI